MNRSSTTAVTVALQRAFESRRPADSRLFVDPYAVDFLTGGWRALAAVSALPLVGPIAPRLYDAVVGPGPRPSAVARTRFIDDVITAEVDGDPTLRQLVILGAGFDSRAHRLTAVRGCRVFEVDHPATQATKRAGSKRATVLCTPLPTSPSTSKPTTWVRRSTPRASIVRSRPSCCGRA